MVPPVGDKFFDRGERCSPASCLPNLRYPPYLASSSTAAKSLRSVLASKLGAAMSFLIPHSAPLGAAMSFLTPHSSLKPLLTPHLTSFLT